MLRSVKPLWFVSTMTVLAACGPMTVEPEFSMTASPRTLDGNRQKSTLKILATDDKSKPGTGSVRVTSTAGSMKDGEEVTLVGGEGTAEFGCDRATDVNCAGTVKLTAEWVVSGKLNTATTSVTITPPVIVLPDAGVSLTASRSQIGLGLGNTVDLVATYAIDGVPAASSPVTMSASIGTLLFTDGGPFVSPATTDSAGQVRAVLTENGVTGVANITAAGATGRSGNASVTIYAPDASVVLTTDRTLLTVGFNELAQLTVSQTLDNRVVPGRLLQLETTAGKLMETDGGAFVSPSRTDLDGRIHAILADTGSSALATVTATDPTFGRSSSVAITLAPPDAGVFITADKPRVYIGVGDSTPVAARLVANGAPAVGRNLQVSTTLGTLSLSDGGVFSGAGITGANGALGLELHEAGIDGVATLTVTDPQSARTATTNVDILRIGTINYTSTNCGPTLNCTVMGIRNSGFNTQATLRFTVRDARTTPQPVIGVRVTFVLNNAPAGTLVTANGITDVNGNVDAVVTSGNSIGSFSVTATVINGVSASSPTIGVRGATPSSKGFQFQCSKVNLPVYRSTTPPLVIPVPCTVILVDRNSNPVGTGTSVQFLAEAGNIPNSAVTQAYVPPNGINEGRGMVAFDTSGTFPAVDVDFLTANPTQFPFARQLEPSRADGLLTRNPRDGLVTLIAYTDGEEWFDDSNANGVRDTGEQFIDQGEPFVDSNDDDVRQNGENYIDVDGNGAWTPPNGTWEASTKIWTKTYLLYTDYSEPSIAFFNPTTFNVAKGTSVPIDVYMPDKNWNVVEQGSTLAITRTSNRGSVTIATRLDLDSYGFVMEPRRLTNPTGAADCTPGLPTCVFRTAFGTWARGPVGLLTLVGASITDANPAEMDTITVRTTVRGATVPANVSGIFQ